MGDTYLLQKVARGDEAAMTACVEQYGNLVWSLARGLLKNQADAEDAVQEIFINLWDNAARFDPRLGKEVTFVSMLARRRLIERIRARGRREAKHDDSFDLETLKSLDHRRVEASSDARRAARAIESLPQDKKAVVALHVVEGMTQGEIAKRLRLPLGTVKSHLRRGLTAIRNEMKRGPDAKVAGT
jgi:RNA polymerase sigma-70 factor (ECF subfamily)